ncbi:DUF58 domain-containing protein [Legionella micdadei]|uniref:DUF58 domain-containing protein n=1 Tax=Legionella micdadei TaxID=451 RepID=A0A098GAS1_LEGMI|nr:DUF58 domain-containing protein [Legionella micdadei]ARG96327.1 DUF58 domain-containing protein [Legionella micdadei]ARG99080.1 DUF58 domain-containing protein [Legionella micdadei]KTD29594.1 hypothetical protein Lmic_0666 [Legionella micdadei]NSL19441.1 DUF58 domain-containing protein [Legionella micdadei]CEG59523.1 conserved protein of unknown function [Legionella micdadei]
MTEGVTVQLDELIALRRYAQRVNYKPAGNTVRAGNHLSKLRGRGMDFAEARNYQAGDEIRHMEWRVTARTGRPHVKLYQEERERPVVILSDFNPSMFFGTRLAFKSVIAARLAAMIAWTAIKQGDRVGGLLFSAKEHNEFTPRSRETGVLPLLASLSQYTNDGTLNSDKSKPLSEVLMRVRRVTRPGSILVLISDFYNLDPDSEQHLSRLRSHNDILVYHICDPLELSPPKPQYYAITDGEQEFLLDTTMDDVTNAYKNFCEERIANLQTQFKRLQIQYVQLTAETSLPQIVRQTFPRRSRG